ncbi:hypothetical protein B0T26DRAFT_709616 [Lasiosphaeria miniovina]|uniref:Uncharacterized protein n=1 Tax=Lasiosphaeria miniovina TaxID=1954250 RepID=A0AA40DXJ7_9PEZI|nr:uncharacterized protein B0T26DRAFT_709616 [Lasiosphaeria miniovina]KAK0717337.1 hypothetical protein B0T26DRAFT_709616 [Lasiosphaeria miniovina]
MPRQVYNSAPQQKRPSLQLTLYTIDMNINRHQKRKHNRPSPFPNQLHHSTAAIAGGSRSQLASSHRHGVGRLARVVGVELVVGALQDGPEVVAHLVKAATARLDAHEPLELRDRRRDADQPALTPKVHLEQLARDRVPRLRLGRADGGVRVAGAVAGEDHRREHVGEALAVVAQHVVVPAIEHGPDHVGWAVIEYLLSKGFRLHFRSFFLVVGGRDLPISDRRSLARTVWPSLSGGLIRCGCASCHSDRAPFPMWNRLPSVAVFCFATSYTLFPTTIAQWDVAMKGSSMSMSMSRRLASDCTESIGQMCR